MDMLDGIPMRDVPPGVMGSTDKHRRLNILVSSGGQVHRIGWLLFGKDASFYIHQTGRVPIVEVGTAIPTGGNLVPIKRFSTTDLPLSCRTGCHISLHPSGEAHIRASTGKVLTVARIGQWLPVQKRFVFAYWFTGPIRALPIAPTGAQEGFPVPDSSKSLRLEIVICPPQRIGDRVGVPYCNNTLFVGGSPHYWILLNGYIIPACDPCIFFLASPV
jgi:hypothetical protein